MAESVELIVDMSDVREKAHLLNRLRELEGFYRIEVVKYRRRRSDRQNRYYWPCFVQPFADFLREQGEPITDEYAHEILKAKFLQTTICSKTTGECMSYVRSTTILSTVEFNEYLDLCSAWLAEMFHIRIPEPNVYHEKPEPEAA